MSLQQFGSNLSLDKGILIELITPKTNRGIDHTMNETYLEYVNLNLSVRGMTAPFVSELPKVGERGISAAAGVEYCPLPGPLRRTSYGTLISTLIECFGFSASNDMKIC